MEVHSNAILNRAMPSESLEVKKLRRSATRVARLVKSAEDWGQQREGQCHLQEESEVMSILSRNHPEETLHHH